MSASDPSLKSQQGVVLLEALIAILIFSMGVLALVGLQAAMIKNTSEAKYRADANYIAQKRIGMMWTDPDGTASGTYNGTVIISDLLPNGVLTVAQPNPVNFPNEYSVTITWQLPGQAQHTFTATANIVGG